jgi:hypothetical protein
MVSITKYVARHRLEDTWPHHEWSQLRFRIGQRVTNRRFMRQLDFDVKSRRAAE